MARIAIAFGVILTVLGVGGYALNTAGIIGNKASWTALIPAIFGVVLILLGAIGRAKPSANKHVMHGAVLVALLAIGGCVGGVVKLIKYLTDSLPAGAETRLSAWVIQSITAGLMVVFVILCVQSFIAARKARSLPTA